MADNIIIPLTGTGDSTKTIATDDAGASGHVQIVKLASSADGSATTISPATEATLGTRLSESDFDTKTGSLTETAPASDTASSGLNGRLQRIAQRLSSVIALLPGSLGQKARASSLAVTLSTEDITALAPVSSVTADTELTTADLDTGAGTDTRAVVGLVGSKSGGGVLIPGDATKGLAVDLSATGANTNKLLVTPDLPASAATSTKQSDGSQKTQVVDGSGNVIGATSNALDVNIKSGASSGTQYTEDAASTADPVGTMMMGVRRDTLSATEVSADGDNIAIKATNKGAVHVKHADTMIVDGSGVTQPVSGTVTTSEAAPTTVLNGKTTVTTAGTRVVLAASTTCKSVTIKALAGNTGTIYVGSSTVAASNGFALAAGETVSMDISNLNTVNIDSSVNGEGVTYIGIN